MAMLDKAKLALRLTTNAYDAEITDLIAAGQLDLGIAGLNGRRGGSPFAVAALHGIMENELT